MDARSQLDNDVTEPTHFRFRQVVDVIEQQQSALLVRVYPVVQVLPVCRVVGPEVKAEDSDEST